MCASFHLIYLDIYFFLFYLGPYIPDLLPLSPPLPSSYLMLRMIFLTTNSSEILLPAIFYYSLFLSKFVLLRQGRHTTGKAIKKKKQGSLYCSSNGPHLSHFLLLLLFLTLYKSSGGARNNRNTDRQNGEKEALDDINARNQSTQSAFFIASHL